MDKLKSAIADKVLEISSSDRSDMKEKLDKINRFRDFVNACQALIEKYPPIESELIRMVELNDFDAKTASIRVDTIIRLSENNTGNTSPNTEIQKDRTRLGLITEKFPYTKIGEGEFVEESYEDIGYKAQQEQYTGPDSFYTYASEDTPNEDRAKDNDDTSPIYRDIVIENDTVKQRTNQIKDTAKKGMHVIIAAAAIIVLIIIIVFIIRDFETVLLGLGILLILAFIVWIIVFNKKDKNTEEEEDTEE